MSLGNVSYSHHNEQYFQQAVRYLRTASSIEGFQLSPYLRRYALILPQYGFSRTNEFTQLSGGLWKVGSLAMLHVHAVGGASALTISLDVVLGTLEVWKFGGWHLVCVSSSIRYHNFQLRPQ